MPTDALDKLRLEMRRGAIVLAVLGMMRQEHYGYSLRKALEDKGIDMDEGTLYPLMRRLETQGLLESEWREDAKRKKRFYRISALGETVLTQLNEDWHSLNAALDKIMGERR